MHLQKHATFKTFKIRILTLLSPHFRKYCPEVVTCDDSAHMSPARRISLLAPMPRHKLVRRAVSNNIAGKGEGGQLDPSWLYPVLLPHLYPTLFLMYRENHADEDRKLDSILDRFGTKTEEELARLFDIHRSEIQCCAQGITTPTHTHTHPTHLLVCPYFNKPTSWFALNLTNPTLWFALNDIPTSWFAPILTNPLPGLPLI